MYADAARVRAERALQRAKAAPTLAGALRAALEAVQAADVAEALGRAHGGQTARDAARARGSATAAVEVAAERAKSHGSLSVPPAVSQNRGVL